MGRLGHGQVVFRAMRVVRGTVFMPGRCDSVFVIILDTMYFAVSQKNLEIRKCEKRENVRNRHSLRSVRNIHVV